jgi:hypothetical protein
MAAWPHGRMAAWPHGRMAAWPHCGNVGPKHSPPRILASHKDRGRECFGPTAPPHARHCHTHGIATRTARHRHTHGTATRTAPPHARHCHAHGIATRTARHRHAHGIATRTARHRHTHGTATRTASPRAPPPGASPHARERHGDMRWRTSHRRSRDTTWFGRSKREHSLCHYRDPRSRLFRPYGIATCVAFHRATATGAVAPPPALLSAAHGGHTRRHDNGHRIGGGLALRQHKPALNHHRHLTCQATLHFALCTFPVCYHLPRHHARRRIS